MNQEEKRESHRRAQNKYNEKLRLKRRKDLQCKYCNKSLTKKKWSRSCCGELKCKKQRQKEARRRDYLKHKKSYMEKTKQWVQEHPEQRRSIALDSYHRRKKLKPKTFSCPTT